MFYKDVFVIWPTPGYLWFGKCLIVNQLQFFKALLGVVEEDVNEVHTAAITHGVCTSTLTENVQ